MPTQLMSIKDIARPTLVCSSDEIIHVAVVTERNLLTVQSSGFKDLSNPQVMQGSAIQQRTN